MGMLDTKLGRDLTRMKSQVLAVALVLTCGLAMLVMTRSMIVSITTAREHYYAEQRFADVFVSLKRAPEQVAERLRDLPGVAVVETGIVRAASLDFPGVLEPATGLLNSIPDVGAPALNAPRLMAGRWPAGNERGEVLVSQPFAEAHGLSQGSKIAAVLNGRWTRLVVVGIALAPNYVFEAPAGAGLPDRRSFGVLWMRRSEMEEAFGLDGAFNAASLTLAPGSSPTAVLASVDRELERYGGLGAYTRADHPSDKRVSDELGVLTGLSLGFPMVFLSVAAFMVHSVLQRQITLQREQIALLKAFGFPPGRIAAHFAGFAGVMVGIGVVLGAIAGTGLGHVMVRMYHIFFRFPELEFQPALGALATAVLAAILAAGLGVSGALQAVLRLAPAEAMRPEPPASFRRSLAERLGIGSWFGISGRMALRNLSRRPWRAVLTALALAMATGILIVPNMFRDGVAHVLFFQWDSVQRQSVTITLVEPAASRALHDIEALPGVMLAEPFRRVPIELAHGAIKRRLALSGYPAGGTLSRIVNERGTAMPVPLEGVVLSKVLRDVLSVREGDVVDARVLQGKRANLRLRVAGFSEDFAGLAAVMELGELDRALGEGDRIDGAQVLLDPAQREAFLTAVKRTPQASGILIKEAMRESFRESTARMIGTIQAIYLLFATVVACGIVYNSAQISLSERARELATLRVLGFSQREVAGVLVMELAFVTAIAVPAGLALGSVFARGLLGAVNTETVRLPFILSPANFAFATVVVVSASVLSASLATRKLNQLSLVGVLKARD